MFLTILLLAVLNITTVRGLAASCRRAIMIEWSDEVLGL